ncbi:hypothetical protein AKJ16_DCAP22059 [Drosera capensis]
MTGSVTHGHRTPTSSTTTPTSGNSKTLRLFGVDLECQLDEPSPDPQSSDGYPMSYAQGSAFHYFDYIANYPQANHPDQMAKVELASEVSILIIYLTGRNAERLGESEYLFLTKADPWKRKLTTEVVFVRSMLTWTSISRWEVDLDKDL